MQGRVLAGHVPNIRLEYPDIVDLLLRQKFVQLGDALSRDLRHLIDERHEKGFELFDPVDRRLRRGVRIARDVSRYPHELFGRRAAAQSRLVWLVVSRLPFRAAVRKSPTGSNLNIQHFKII
jgi:hypothetical protein